jgi:cellobiose PTS system EIIB component
VTVQELWAKVESIRAQMEAEGIEINPDAIWGDVRDRSGGREIIL